MLNRRHTLLTALSTGIVGASGAAFASPGMEAIRASLNQAVGAGGQIAGILAMTIGADGTSTMITDGSSGANGVALNGDAVFEIMSITKIFTALLLADMVARGDVAFDDPVAKYLPVTLPVTGRPITLLDLATYGSGLPVMPPNMPASGDYTEAQLFEFLAGFSPKYEAGTHYEYANLAFGVLGIALARRADKSYKSLLMERICAPLGLTHTRITLSDEMRQLLVVGHEVNLKPSAPWNVPVMPGMASISSNASDLASFLKACIGIVPSPLSASLARLTRTRRPTSLPGTEAGLGWFITTDGGEPIIWKTGLGSGCNTFIGYSPSRRWGAIVLCNFLWLPIDTGTTRIGMKMIKPGFPDMDFRALYPFG